MVLQRNLFSLFCMGCQILLLLLAHAAIHTSLLLLIFQYVLKYFLLKLILQTCQSKKKEVTKQKVGKAKHQTYFWSLIRNSRAVLSNMSTKSIHSPAEKVEGILVQR